MSFFRGSLFPGVRVFSCPIFGFIFEIWSSEASCFYTCAHISTYVGFRWFKPPAEAVFCQLSEQEWSNPQQPRIKLTSNIYVRISLPYISIISMCTRLQYVVLMRWVSFLFPIWYFFILSANVFWNNSLGYLKKNRSIFSLAMWFILWNPEIFKSKTVDEWKKCKLSQKVQYVQKNYN